MQIVQLEEPIVLCEIDAPHVYAVLTHFLQLTGKDVNSATWRVTPVFDGATFCLRPGVLNYRIYRTNKPTHWRVVWDGTVVEQDAELLRRILDMIDYATNFSHHWPATD